jgi:streptogramin lyase
MAASPIGTVTNYSNPGISAPFRITSGSDGALWYVNVGSNSVGRVSLDGTVTNYAGAGVGRPTDIVAGPDGALWFTNQGTNRIGRITVAGSLSVYADPDGGIAEPYAMAVGADGALWFTNHYDSGSIGRIDPTSKVVTHFHAGEIPGDIAAGPDGALWFTSPLSDQSTIWRITTAGEISSFTDYERVSAPEEIAAGPDGALWFTQSDATIGRITTTGVVTTYPSGSGTVPECITIGPDGALWYTFPGEDKVGRMTTDGVATTFTGVGAGPRGITKGPDGALWFTSYDDARIGRMTTAGVVTDLFRGLGISDPHAIALGSDGALWFTNHDNSTIGRATAGGFVTTYIDPGISQPYDIVAGPDGALWFTNQGSNTIGRITTAGVVTTYTDGAISVPLDITVGPDGALWFTADNPGLGSIARMTTTGAVTARHVGDMASYDINGPRDIIAADGALWYVNGTSLGRITTAGVASHWYPAGAFIIRITLGPDGDLWATTMIGDRLERFSTDVAELPSGSQVPLGPLHAEYIDASMYGTREIAAGPDGALWFTNGKGNSIGRITTAGVASSYSGYGISTPEHITAGPDGALWFTNPGNDSIGRIESGTQAPEPAAPGAPTMTTATAGDGSVTLAWTAPSSDGGSTITGYNVYQGTTAGGEGATPVATLGGSATGTTINSLTNGTPYYFTVTAVNGIGEGVASNEVSATPAALLPGTLSITGPTSGSYGQSLPIVVSGSSGTGALSFDAANSTACEIDGSNVVISAGSGTCTITATRASDGIYASTTSDPFTVAIGPASLTVTADDRSIMYGQATPSFAVTYAGFATGDGAASLGGSLSYSFAGIGGTTYGPSSTPPIHAGTYSITPSGLTGDNYAISYAAGTYTINAVSVNTTLSSGGITPNPATVGQSVSFPGVLAKPYVAGQLSTISDTNLTVQLRTWGDAACSFGSGYNVRDEQAIDATGHVTLHYTPPSAGTYHVSLFFQPQTSGDSYYGQSSSACLALTVNPAKLDQTITFPAPADVTYGDEDVALGATANSGLTVSYVTSTPSVCTIVDGKLHVVAAGDCTITASQAGSATYNAAPSVSQTFAIAKAPLAVTAQERTITYGQATPTFGVIYNGFAAGDAAADLGGALLYTFAGVGGTTYPASTTPPTWVGHYAITPSDLTSSDYAITFVAGEYIINAVRVETALAWSGSVTPNPAPVGQPITFPGALTASGSGTAIGETSLQVQLLEATDSSCELPGSTRRDFGTIDASGHVALSWTPGVADIGAHHLMLVFYQTTIGATNYADAVTACALVTVNPAKLDQSITFTAPTGVTYGDADLSLGATANSGLAVSYVSSTPGVCTLVAGQLHVVAPGSCTITASQAGDATYNEAPNVTRSFTIEKAAQATLSISGPASVTYGHADYDITTTGGSSSGALSFDAGISTACSIVSNKLHVVTGTGTCSITATQAADANYAATTSVAFDVTVAKATATVVYSGQTYQLLASGTTILMTLTANVAPTICGPVLFTVIASDGTTPPALSGSTSTFTLAAGMYDIVAAASNPNCTAARDEAVLAVVSPADAANGGGWYKATTIQTGSPRVNLGFTIQKTTKSIKGSTNVTVTYKGGLLWLNNDQWRLKATISTTTVTTAAGVFVSGDPFPYGTMAACPAAFTSTLPAGSTPKCGSLTGKGTLERWDSTANGGLGGWVASTAYGPTVTFTATIYDGGQVKVCTKRSCTTTSNPDWFGIQFDPVPSSVIRESAPFPLSGGALKAS